MANIKVIAPARWIDENTASRFCVLAQRYGHHVSIDPQCFLRSYQLAGADVDRAESLERALNDTEVDVIWCARGGYGSGRLLPLLGKSSAKGNKILIGYSDITYLLIRAPVLGLRAVHGPVVADVSSPEKIHNLTNLMSELDSVVSGKAKSTILGRPSIQGAVEGNLVAANLTVLTHMLGTPYIPILDEAILLIEDVGEYKYAIDRMFSHLDHCGVLRRIRGLALGSFTEIGDNVIEWGQSVTDIAHHHFRPYRMPLAFDFPVGHGNENAHLEMFSPVSFRVNEKRAELISQERK